MNFWFKLFNFLLCVCVIVSYNFFVDINTKDNTIKELNTKVSSLEKQVEYDDNYIKDIKINKNNGKESKVEETTISFKYKDGTYDGEAKGFGGNIIVSLTVKNDIITEINVVSAGKEDSSYLASAKNIINTMLNKQTTDVDTVSGATFSSTGIKNAATIAINKALK